MSSVLQKPLTNLNNFLPYKLRYRITILGKATIFVMKIGNGRPIHVSILYTQNRIFVLYLREAAKKHTSKM